MKKTVSWSTESIKREAISDALTHDVEVTRNNQSMTTSSSAYAPFSNMQVNLRIQQMIAMQKAQNATMRQLMSTGHGVSSVSPSGLRDLVTYKAKSRAEMIDCDVKVCDSEPLCGASKVEPLEPPTHQVAGIQFQGLPKSISLPPPSKKPPPSYSTKREVLSSPVLTPPHLHPEMPNYGSHNECDSPVSYNSVLDHNFTPSKVQERKRAHHQNQSQLHLMERQEDGTNNNIRVSDAASICEYSLHVMGHHARSGSSCHAPNTSNENKLTIAKPGTNLSDRKSLSQVDQNQNIVHLSLYDTEDSHKRNSPLGMHTHHKFHYGSNVGQPYVHYNNCDIRHCDQTCVDDLMKSHLDKDIHLETPNSSSQLLQLRLHRRRQGILFAILCYPLQCLFSSEPLSRSFCFGAIDGMLTGAGILSACVGLGLLSQPDEALTHIKWIPIALTLSATFSDGICMAIGHVWSTGLDASAAYEERKEELHNFEMCRSDAKARLVDALLLQGMLKIDAMSLADTLEGYPDLFVTAILGGGLYVEPSHSGDVIGHTGLGNSGGLGMIRVPGDSQRQHRHQPFGDVWDVTSLPQGPRVMSGSGLKYDQFCEISGFRDNSELKALSETVSESRLEGFFMMLSFSSFSVIPSLIYTLLPSVGNFTRLYGDVSSDTLIALLTLCLTSIIMFLLGVWKSNFYSSNWFLFGLKNIGVLAVCVATAYSLGFICVTLISGQN
ncbi:hypothetical protein ACHAXR_008904 [Thalassiosira sp. AJA248-18]